jgi:hypothetical protein
MFTRQTYGGLLARLMVAEPARIRQRRPGLLAGIKLWKKAVINSMIKCKDNQVSAFAHHLIYCRIKDEDMFNWIRKSKWFPVAKNSLRGIRGQWRFLPGQKKVYLYTLDSLQGDKADFALVVHNRTVKVWIVTEGFQFFFLSSDSLRSQVVDRSAFWVITNGFENISAQNHRIIVIDLGNSRRAAVSRYSIAL